MPGDIRLNIILDEHGSIKKIEATDKSIKNLKTTATETSPKINALSTDIKNISPPAGAAARGFTDVKTSITNMAKSFGPGALAIAGIYGAFRVLSESISLASRESEMYSKLQAVFPNLANETAAAVANLTENYNLSKLEAEDLLGSTGNLFTSLGMLESQALQLSQGTQQLAADLVSFTDYSGGVAGASEALRKLFLGEGEAAKALGLNITQMDVAQRLLEKGQDKLSGAALKSAKAFAAYELAVQYSKNAIGDLARTQDSFANQQRKLEAAIEDLKVEIGKAFVEGLLPALRSFADWMKSNKDMIAGGFKLIGESIRFAFGPVEALGYIRELQKQTTAAAQTAGAQAADFDASFKKIYAALREAGLGFQEFEKITSGMKSAKSLEDLTSKQQKLKSEIESLNILLKSTAGTYEGQEAVENRLASATKQLNNLTSERNLLLSQQAQEIVRNSEKYGVSNAIIEKTRQILRGNIIAQVESAAATRQSAAALTEVDRIAQKYNVSNQSATEILQKMKPEIGAAADLQKKLGISEAEAAKVVGILSGLEKKKTEVLAEQNIVIPELISNIKDLDDLTESLAGAEEDLGRVIDAGPTQAYYGLEKEIQNTNETLEDNEDKMKAAADAAKDAELEIQGLTSAFDLLSSMEGVPDDLAIGFQTLSGVIQNLASGNVIGAVITGIGGLFSMITGKTKEAKSAVEEYREATEKLNEVLEITYDDLVKGQEALDNYVDSMKNAIATGNATLSTFWNLNAGLAAQEQNLDKLRQTTEFYADTVNAMLPALNDFLKVPAQNAEDFNSQVTITMSTFANLLKSGIPITQALDKMGDSFDMLIASQEKLGLKGDATFEALMKYRNLVKENEDLVKSVEGLGSAYAALAKMDPGDQAAASAFAKSAQSQFDQLTKAGFSATQAYQMLGPGLMALKEQVDKGSISVDENTKKLLANAEAAGAFEGMADPMDTVAKVLEGIFLLLGGTNEQLAQMGVTGQASTAAAASGVDDVAVSVFNLNGELQGADDSLAGMASTAGAASKEMITAVDNFAEKGAESVMTMAEAADQTARDMKDSFSEMSKEGVLAVTDMVSKSADLLEKLGDIDLKLNLGGDLPLKGKTTPPKKNFAAGTPAYGFTVPPGYPADSFRVGVSSGERVTVSKSGDVNNSKSETVLNQAVYINNPSLSSGALALMLTDALQQNKNNMATVLKKVVGNG